MRSYDPGISTGPGDHARPGEYDEYIGEPSGPGYDSPPEDDEGRLSDRDDYLEAVLYQTDHAKALSAEMEPEEALTIYEHAANAIEAAGLGGPAAAVRNAGDKDTALYRASVRLRMHPGYSEAMPYGADLRDLEAHLYDSPAGRVIGGKEGVDRLRSENDQQPARWVTPLHAWDVFVAASRVAGKGR